MEQFKFPDEVSPIMSGDEIDEENKVEFSIEGEGEVDVEVVDDTPEEDKGRKPLEKEVEDVTELYQGKRELAGQTQVPINGRNICRSPVVSVTVTVTGSSLNNRVLRRSTATPGDTVALAEGNLIAHVAHWHPDLLRKLAFRFTKLESQGESLGSDILVECFINLLEIHRSLLIIGYSVWTEVRLY